MQASSLSPIRRPADILAGQKWRERKSGAWLLAALALWCAAVASAQSAPAANSLFAGPPAAYENLLEPAAAAQAGYLRRISVEERAGVARHGALVRVPLFFSAGECADPDQLAIVPAGGASAGAVSWQADDIRRGPDGGISRLHAWFVVNLQPFEKRSYLLVRRSRAADAPAVPDMVLQKTADEIRIKTGAGWVVFNRDGALRSLPGALPAASDSASAAASGWNFGAAGVFPRVVVAYPQNGKAQTVVLDRATPGRDVQWAAGPLFSKVRLRLAADGMILEEEFRIPRDGRDLTVTAVLSPGKYPGSGIKVEDLLEGPAPAAARKLWTVQEVPAGIRRSLRAEQAYRISALSGSGSASLLAVPLVIGGTNGCWWLTEKGTVTLSGPHGLRRGDEGEKNTLYAYWDQVRLVPAVGSVDQLWETYRAHVQPLVAVVDEPGVTLDDLHAALCAVVREMKPIGWQQTVGRAVVLGEKSMLGRVFAHAPPSWETDPQALLRSARRAREKLTAGGRRLREYEKGRAYGAIDPYQITYSQSAAAALAVLGQAPPVAGAADLAAAQAVREFGGRTDDTGSPYVDCFNRTLNMQLGPVLFGLTAGAAAGDAGLVRFYRDVATAPPVLGVFGRGQRPYTGARTTAPEQTDYLYQSICDFWLRAAELLGHENLSLHPLAYGRYTDCMDVMADQYHGVGPRDKPGTPGLAQANFFRGQFHTHRWLGWSCSPFIRLLETPADAEPVGLTDAVRYAQAQKGRWKNWPDLTFYILADLLVREALPQAAIPALPPRPVNLIAHRGADGMDLSWTPVPGAAGYRVYRAATPGGPYRWLNSPYTTPPAPPVAEPHFHDGTGDEHSGYVVLTVDISGRASAWPE